MRAPNRSHLDLLLLTGRSSIDVNHLYAVGFANGTTKIGVSYKVRERVSQLCTLTKSDVLWAHAFAPRTRRAAMAVERKALAAAAAISEHVQGEWFRGLDRSAALECVRAADRSVLAAAAVLRT